MFISTDSHHVVGSLHGGIPSPQPGRLNIRIITPLDGCDIYVEEANGVQRMLSQLFLSTAE
ncbi:MULTISPECIES: hypothetical protein [Methanocalculus]|uniref:hypothetical protein n=1 Tax=Methanocalculus TaxID=71151 RepID=UPI002699DCD9